MAGTYFKSLVEQYPYGKYAEDATFLAAKCDYTIAPRAELDQENCRNCNRRIQSFYKQVPLSPRVEEAKNILKSLRTDLLKSRI